MKKKPGFYFTRINQLYEAKRNILYDMIANRTNPLLAILLIIAIPAILLALVFWGRGKEPGTTTDQKAFLTEIMLSDRTKGNENAKIELIEYSDFQCPACGAYYPYVKQITEEFSGQIRFAYRHFPLRQHKNAELAGRAAEAAGKQNKFWEIHDLLFENQQTWSNSDKAGDIFTVFAAKLDLDVEKFGADINSKEVKDKVADDLKSGLSIRVNATPTFILNGKLLNPNQISPQALREQINAAIKNQ